MTDEDLERILCDDGMCTGVVGDDGRCGTCGRRCETAPPRDDDRHIVDAREEDAAPDAAPDATPSQAAAPEVPDAPATSDDDRTLCPDGMCTGILGADGACGTCGARG